MAFMKWLLASELMDDYDAWTIVITNVLIMYNGWMWSIQVDWWNNGVLGGLLDQWSNVLLHVVMYG